MMYKEGRKKGGKEELKKEGDEEEAFSDKGLDFRTKHGD